ncbi:MAG: hypothetical protein ACKVU4_08425 [Phycisphaerales bacterium]
MTTKRWTIGRVWAAIALAAVLLVTPARAGDKVHLKDGRVLEGTITREVEGIVWIKVKYGGMEQEQMFLPAQVDRVERDAGAPPTGDKARPASDAKGGEPAKPRMAGVPRLAILTLGEQPDKDMVGLYMTAESLREAIPMLKEEGVTDVIFKINSGGGFLLEIKRLSDVIHNEFKPEFRTVAWIESAISAAAMTAHCIEEIYLMPQGNYGACTGWSGALVAVKDRDLEEVLFLMEKISARGGYDPKIMRAMQIMEPLSYTVDANGDVHYYQDLSGKHVLNPEGQILTFNAQTAMESKFSKGIAATKEELAKLMGYQEVEWAGTEKRGESWPISRGEDHVRKFRDKTHQDETQLRGYFEGYQTAVARAQGMQDRKDRAKFVGRATQYLDKIEAMVDNNENMAIMIGMLPTQFREWIEEQRKLLRDLMR